MLTSWEQLAKDTEATKAEKEDESEEVLDDEGNTKIKKRLGRPLGHKRGPSVDDKEEDSDNDSFVPPPYLDKDQPHHRMSKGNPFKDCCGVLTSSGGIPQEE